MYKLLIVDDETSVRERLSAIDWASFGIEVTGTAEHGLAALKAVYENPPEIILTDINMPVMNGIDMIKQIHANYKWIKIVVLTGYDDFNYVRDCMRSSVFDYILKPINEDELAASFRRLVTGMGSDYLESVKYDTVKQQNRLIVKGLRARFLRHYFTRSMSQDEIEERCAYAEINLDCSAYCVLLFRPDLDKSAAEYYGKSELELIVFALDNILTEFLETNESAYVWVNPENAECCLLICGRKNPDELSSLAEEVKNTIYNIAQLLDTTVSCAAGKYVTARTNIRASLENAQKLLDLKKGDDIYIASQDSTDTNDKSGEAVLEKEPGSEDSSSIKLITRAAIDYIDKNFAKTITLDDVAAHVYLSSTYVSYLFRSEVKMNFITYLTMKRMEKAKELLRDPRIKIYEISIAVGYENSRYFSSIFKKYTGQTPIEYRGSIGMDK